ncbi:MAG: hypothetical protein BM485_04520 [Desulfobulbaceae bacterium DB1]|nr:MAG: hypothetical protein BM485_04520 [Desulfobulbaceae bacterium DB1]
MAIPYIYKSISLLAALGMALSTGGCSPLGRNLVQEDTAKLEFRTASNSIVVGSANVYEKNDKLIVSGSVNRASGSRGRIRGHVDINVIDPDGKLLTRQTTALLLPANSHSNGRSSRFLAYLDSVPPPGSVIQVAAHKGSHQ